MNDVKTFGVIGAGQMGPGIAQVAAQAGMDVVLLDASDELAQGGKKRIAADLEKLVGKGKLDAATRDATLARIDPKSGPGSLSGCDFCVEAATENVEVKLRLFADADAALP